MIGLDRGCVRIVAYQPTWRFLFEEEAARLRAALGERLLQVEHIGSTAIEGMSAKPVIDVMGAIRRLAEVEALVPLVETLGYDYKRDDPRPNRAFFAKGPPSRRTHHLHLTELATVYWEESILFRDYLRTHPDAAEAYGRLKRRLAGEYPEDRESYAAGKTDFVKRIVALARSCR